MLSHQINAGLGVVNPPPCFPDTHGDQAPVATKTPNLTWLTPRFHTHTNSINYPSINDSV